MTFLTCSVFSYLRAPVQFSMSIPPAFPRFCYLAASFSVGTGLRREHLWRVMLVSVPARVRHVSGQVVNPPHEGTAAKLNCTIAIGIAAAPNFFAVFGCLYQGSTGSY